MKKIESVKEAFALENLDPDKIEITGVPERHVDALKALAELFVVVDAVNSEFNPDYKNPNQRKYEPFWEMGSPSGSGFSFDVFDYWHSASYVGARLVSENREATEYIAEKFPDLYKRFMVYDRKVE